jgi:hypothetical protein
VGVPAALDVSPPSSWVYRLLLESLRASVREARGPARESASASAMETEGGGLGWGCGSGESSAQIFFPSFFCVCKLLDRSWYRRQGEVAGTRAQDTGADPAIGTS